MTYMSKRRSSYYASCPKCGATDVPHATIGIPCPVAKRSPQPTANDEHLARVALSSVHSAGRLQYLASLVGPGQALKLHDRAREILAEQERRSR